MWKQLYEEMFGDESSNIPYFMRIGVDLEYLYQQCVEQHKTWQEILDIDNRKY